MVQEHDFKKFPELTKNQMNEFYWDSPHKQVPENFTARVVKVTDGDTVRLEWVERDFDFPIRFKNLAAPEKNEPGGPASQKWLESQILGKEVEIELSDQRVEKWGRLLGEVFHDGNSMSELSVINGFGVPWNQRASSIFPDFDRELKRIEI